MTRKNYYLNTIKYCIISILISLFFYRYAFCYYNEDVILAKNMSLITKNFDKSTKDINNLIKKYNLYKKDYKFELIEDTIKVSNTNLIIKLEDYNLFIKDIENICDIKFLSKEEVLENEYLEKIESIKEEKINHKKEILEKLNISEFNKIDLIIELNKIDMEIEEIEKICKEDKYINCTLYLEENNKLEDIINKNNINDEYSLIQKLILKLAYFSSYFISIILLVTLILIIKKIKKVCE